jgi:fluoride exporter
MLGNFLLVALGGALGSALRYAVSLATGPTAFPWATLLVNVLGSLAIGLVLALGLKNQAFAQQWKLLLATGVCGGFTTFSAFAAENLQLLQQGRYWLCLGYTAISVVAGIAAAFMGFKLIN